MSTLPANQCYLNVEQASEMLAQYQRRNAKQTRDVGQRWFTVGSPSTTLAQQ